MASYKYGITVEVSEPLSRRDYKDMVEAVEKTVSGSGGKWDPEDFSGDVYETVGTVEGVAEESD